MGGGGSAFEKGLRGSVVTIEQNDHERFEAEFTGANGRVTHFHNKGPNQLVASSDSRLCYRCKADYSELYVSTSYLRQRSI